MQDRFYGEPPYSIVVLHGGPGAQGSMGYVAKELGKQHSVFEPMQRALSVQGQVEELHAAVFVHCQPPVTLIGWSWGAWLGWWFAAQYPALVKRLILVSSGPFETRYTQSMEAVRLSHLSPDEQTEMKSLLEQFDNPNLSDKDTLFERFGELFGKADSFDPTPVDAPPTEMDMELYQAIWPEGASLRKTGALLKVAGKIIVPVVAIHGDYDPHPWQGVKEPLEERVHDFTFHLLPNCGHEPWRERSAQEPFFSLLDRYL